MTIRRAGPEDAAAIAEIWNHEVRTGTATFTSIDKTASEIVDRIARAPVLVCETHGGVAGFATFGPFRAGPGYARVAEHSIYLRPAARRTGQGRCLMVALESAARDDGRDILIAAIGGENAGAVAFHAALGFRRVGLLPGLGEKFGRRHDLVLMQKNL